MSEELTKYVTQILRFWIVIAVEKYVVYRFVIRCQKTRHLWQRDL